MAKLPSIPVVIRRFVQVKSGPPCEGHYEYNVDRTGWIDEKTYHEWKESLVREMWKEDELEHMGLVQTVQAYDEAEARGKAEAESLRQAETETGYAAQTD